MLTDKEVKRKMAQKQQPPQEPTSFDKAEVFFQKYKNIIIGVLVAIVLIAGYFIWRGYDLEKKEAKAKPLMQMPQAYFSQDSFRVAIMGDGQNLGFLDIINRYSGTPSANLAHYYAGIGYLQIGEFQSAVDHLKDFDAETDLIGSRAYEALGHAYAELGQTDNAAKNYRRAANEIDNEALTPYYLKQAGDYMAAQNNWAEAEKMYQRIKDNYPSSREGQNINKSLEFVRIKKQG